MSGIATVKVHADAKLWFLLGQPLLPLGHPVHKRCHKSSIPTQPLSEPLKGGLGSFTRGSKGEGRGPQDPRDFTLYRLHSRCLIQMSPALLFNICVQKKSPSLLILLKEELACYQMVVAERQRSRGNALSVRKHG